MFVDKASVTYRALGVMPADGAMSHWLGADGAGASVGPLEDDGVPGDSVHSDFDSRKEDVAALSWKRETASRGAKSRRMAQSSCDWCPEERRHRMNAVGWEESLSSPPPAPWLNVRTTGRERSTPAVVGEVGRTKSALPRRHKREGSEDAENVERNRLTLAEHQSDRIKHGLPGMADSAGRSLRQLAR